MEELLEKKGQEGKAFPQNTKIFEPFIIKNQLECKGNLVKYDFSRIDGECKLIVQDPSLDL